MIVIHFIGQTDLFVPETDLGEVKVVGWEVPARLTSYSLRSGVRNVWNECQYSVSRRIILTICGRYQ